MNNVIVSQPKNQAQEFTDKILTGLFEFSPAEQREILNSIYNSLEKIYNGEIEEAENALRRRTQLREEFLRGRAPEAIASEPVNPYSNRTL